MGVIVRGYLLWKNVIIQQQSIKCYDRGEFT